MADYKEVPFTCDACYERPAVVQIVIGAYYPQPVPVCKSCALDALNNPDDWFIYVPTQREYETETESNNA